MLLLAYVEYILTPVKQTAAKMWPLHSLTDKFKMLGLIYNGLHSFAPENLQDHLFPALRAQSVRSCREQLLVISGK